LLGGCTSSEFEAKSDGYFEPIRVTQVTEGPEGTAVPEFTSPGNIADGAEPMLRKVLRDQGRRMAELERRLATLETRQDVAEVESERRRELTPGEEALLAMIREQNLRLEEIMEQVRLMSERRDQPVRVAQRSAPRRASSSVAASSPKALYAAGIKAYQKGQYRQAEAHLSSALQASIAPALADNCRFWIGVSRFQRNDLMGARLALDPVSRDNSSDKRTSAILMLGQVFEGMGRRDMARNAYERIVREHPQSSLRSVAERKLATAKMIN
jgi:TolA-binding protein